MLILGFKGLRFQQGAFSYSQTECCVVGNFANVCHNIFVGIRNVQNAKMTKTAPLGRSKVSFCSKADVKEIL